MNKPIVMTEEICKSMETDFLESLRGLIGKKFPNGEFKFSQKFKWGEQKKAQVIISDSAYLKMATLVQSSAKEVGWHCISHRDPDDSAKFFIDDVLVYPQQVTATTVDTDQKEYELWLMNLEGDTLNNLRVQCHSHVNMSVTPSGVDEGYWAELLSQVKDYYIFMIWNKSFEKTVRIYDVENNVLYDDPADISVIEPFGFDKFLEDSNKLVKPYKYTSPASSQSAVGSYTYKGRDYSSYDDDDLPPYPYGKYESGAAKGYGYGSNASASSKKVKFHY